MAVDYLRLSLTDRCNLNCIYCTPMEKEGFLAHDQLLRHEEIARAAAAFVRAGVTKIRLTGGEPLVKKNIVGLVKLLRAIPGLRELALTTNGLLLPGLAAPLREAGLDRLNISLDTLNPGTFKKITGSDGLAKVLAGLEASQAAGFADTKLNMVVMRRINDAEVPDFARLSLGRPLTVRFIEFYPANARSARLGDALFTTAETKKLIEDSVGALRELPPAPGGGPARVYALAGAAGKIGFISGRSSYFCGACNRMRMDCAGKVYPCLYSPATHDLKDLLRGGANDEALADHIKKIFLVKSKYRKDSSTAGHVEMSSLGG